MLYITETNRFLEEPFKGMPKQLTGVRATVSDKAEDATACSVLFSPNDWKKLLDEPGVMYRYRKEPYQLMAEINATNATAAGLEDSTPSL